MQVADPARLGRLGLDEVLDWAAIALNRVDHSEFFKSFRDDCAVQYFYEPFLHAFDPELRKELGVWYTPEGIVRYQVERVDAVLRSELGLADGLADPRVVVLDPCCGTGAYLREVLRRIATTLQDKGGDALVANDLKQAAMERVFGFEIMPAPFVIAHLQLGMVLESLGAPLSDSGDPPERAGVYLTNALTGWEPPKGKPKQIAFPGFEEERDAAGKVKQEKPILVILGNPPYNAFAGVSPEEEHGLVEPYKKGLISEWGIKKFNLDELYTRFLRLAERRIAEISGRGVVCYISSFSYISDPSFVVVRKRFLDEFDSIWIDCLNGDSRETGKKTPDGDPDPSVFSTEWNRAGIQLGTAVGLFVKHGRERGESAELTNLDKKVRFRHFWGRTKREDLLASLEVQDFEGQYEFSKPRKEFRWNLRPLNVTPEYMSWPQLPELSQMPPTLGILDNRQEALISHDKEKLSDKVKKYLDPEISWEELATVIPEITKNYARFDARKARTKILAAEPFIKENLRRVFMRPMDNRWCYYTSVRPIWTETRPKYVQQCWSGNTTLVSRRKGIADPEGPPFFFTSILGMQHSLHTDAYYIPLQLLSGSRVSRVSGDKNGELDFPDMERPTESITANLSSAARDYLESLGLPDPDTDQDTANLIWYHTLAIGYSPAYLEENADGIQQDWPRIPLPQAKDFLVSSASLGRQVTALLDTETPVPGVTVGKIGEKLRSIAVFQRVDGKPANPEAGDLDLTAGWGHAGGRRVTMPGKGKLVGRSAGAFDIYLNDDACWRNVPESVWNYNIGGYQVIKKWLSYREKPLLGRSLTPEEVRFVTEMARRLAALIALQQSLNENYKNIIRNTYSW